MKIQNIQNYQYNNCRFLGTTVPHYTINKNPDNNKDQKNNNLPEWVRKGMLFTLIFFTFKNDPTVQNILKSSDIKRDEQTRKEYFEDTRELGEYENLFPAAYHLNRLADVDNIEIKNSGKNIYNLTLNLDSTKINTIITITPYNENSLSGIIKDNKNTKIHYKAVFSKDNPNEFEIQMRNQNNDRYILGRTPKGELYKIDGNKKIILNKKNVEKYQKSIENIPDSESLKSLEFFTNQNDMWRKLNLILLVFLLFNEMHHDNAKRKEQN